MRKIIILFCLIIFTFSANAKITDEFQNLNKDLNLELSEKTQETDKYIELKRAFWNTFHKMCMNEILHTVDITQKNALAICDCYSLATMDKIDWQKLSSMNNEGVSSYLTSLSRFDDEIEQECKERLYHMARHESVTKTVTKRSSSNVAIEAFWGSIVVSLLFSLLGYIIACIMKKS